ncbi:hypothetical protein [Priestia aryabhattai]|nr:hypothetical protein [Priestia aryabhattai]
METRTSRHKREKDVMNDDMYRQVLQKFREGEKDDTVFTKEERDVMNDDAFRKALRSFKKNDNE